MQCHVVSYDLNLDLIIAIAEPIVNRFHSACRILLSSSSFGLPLRPGMRLLDAGIGAVIVFCRVQTERLLRESASAQRADKDRNRGDSPKGR